MISFKCSNIGLPVYISEFYSIGINKCYISNISVIWGFSLNSVACLHSLYFMLILSSDSPEIMAISLLT